MQPHNKKRSSVPQRMRCVAYLRVSSLDQAENGISLDAQREKVESYAALYDLAVVAVEVDAGVSAKALGHGGAAHWREQVRLKRPGLHCALSLLEDDAADALVVVKLDRLTRSVRDLGMLIEDFFKDGRWTLLSVTDQIDTRSAGGRLVLNVLGSVAQWEREVIGERTSEALRHKSRRGEHTGGVAPFGFTLGERGGALLTNYAEQEAIAIARQGRSRGLSLRAIARMLNERGFAPRKATRFGPMQVKRILERPAEAPGGGTRATRGHNVRIVRRVKAPRGDGEQRWPAGASQDGEAPPGGIKNCEGSNGSGE